MVGHHRKSTDCTQYILMEIILTAPSPKWKPHSVCPESLKTPQSTIAPHAQNARSHHNQIMFTVTMYGSHHTPPLYCLSWKTLFTFSTGRRGSKEIKCSCCRKCLDHRRSLLMWRWLFAVQQRQTKTPIHVSDTVQYCSYRSVLYCKITTVHSGAKCNTMTTKKY